MENRELISPASLDPDRDLASAQSALDRLAGEVEHNERLATLGILAAGVAHEINNILTPVLAYAQMALARRDDQELRTKALEKTVHGVEMATQIAESILGFAGRSDQTDADVALAVQGALDCTARDPHKDRIQIHLEVQPNTIVAMNPLNLQQVLLNLILNARSAMKSGGGRLTIAAITRADGTIGIRVSDTGPGIPREVAGRIFEPFVTTKRDGTNAGTGGGGTGGRGLGLSICRRLVEEARGTITATSKPDEGTTFLIILPCPKARRAKAG